MTIRVERKIFTENSTIGEMSINGNFLCYTLEDKDRGLKQSDGVLNKVKKLFGVTAIPKGEYDLVINFSNRFKKYMPQILNVPCFEGVRIHTGNTSKDTEGCIIVGMDKAVDFVGKSRIAYDRLMEILEKAEKTEKIKIQIV